MRKIEITTILLFIIVLSISAVSATDLNSTSLSNHDINDVSAVSSVDNASSTISTNAQSNNVSDSNLNIISSSAKTVSVTDSSYSKYFDNDGNLLSTSGVNSGDTIDLSGTFNNRNFTIKTPLTITSSSNNAILYNATISIYNTGSGSTISNLKIINSNDDGTGIMLYNATNNVIKNNNISVNGLRGFAVALNTGSDYNTISNNYLKTTETSIVGKTHSTLVLGGANYNNIKDNYVTNDGVNAIYLSLYGSGKFSGGLCYFNNITGNTVTCLIDNPTSWNYGIQMMGANNKAFNNSVTGTYRGISSSGNNNDIISNNVSGVIGDYGIYGSDNSTISGNTITKTTSTAAIYTLSNSKVSNNNINVKGSTMGIQSAGSNINISDNTINTISGTDVYTMGQFSNIIINNNTLTSSSATPILIKKQSSSKYPDKITITNNKITGTTTYAIDAREAGSTYLIRDNTITGNGTIGYPTQSNTTNGSGFNGKEYTITPENYNSFFDNNGQIISGTLSDGDKIFFTGNFTNKNITLSSRLKVLGTGANFYNTTFKVTASGCDIEGLNIINNNPNRIDQWGIYVASASNVKIINNYINITDKDAAYAIYLYDSHNDNVSYNTLISSGEYLTYTLLSYETSENYIAYNNIYTNGTSQNHTYESEACIDGSHNVPEIYRTYGILSIFTSNTNITNNNVNVTSGLTKVYNPYNESTNSIVGIDIYYDSNNNTVSNNNILISGNDPFIYGTGVLGAQTGVGNTTANNNKFTSNNINLNGNYFTSGIITGYNSKNTTIANNNVTCNAKTYAYGVTLEISQANNVYNNNINTKAIANYVIEMFDSNNNIINNNKINGNGSYTYGISGYKSSNNTITSNQINAKGDESVNPETTIHGDAIPVGNAGIFLYKNSDNNTIKTNTIITNAVYAVNSTTSSNTVVGNGLKSANYTGDAAVNPQSSLVHDNYGVSTNVSTVLVLNGLSENYGAGDNLTGKLTDSNGNVLVGHHIALNLTNPRNSLSKVYWVTTDTNGEIQLQINLYIGTYTASASYAGSKINNITYIGSNSDTVSIQVLNVSDNRTSTVLTANKFNQKVGAGQNFTGILKDSLGKLLIGQHIALNLTRLSNGQSKVYWVTTDTDGAFQLAINLGIGEYSAKCSYAGTSTYQPSTASNTITVTA